MQQILILGAGLSSSTLIRYLLDHSSEYGWHIVLGDANEELATQKETSGNGSLASCVIWILNKMLIGFDFSFRYW